MGFQLLPDACPARGAYFWLAYLAIPVATASFAYPPSARVEWVTAIGIAGCLPLYFWSFWLKDRQVLLPIGGFLALGLATTPVNTGLFVLFGYAAAISGRIVSRAVVVLTVLAITVTTTIALFFGGTPLVWIAVSVAMLVFGAAISAYFGELGRQLVQAETDARHLAVVSERERIARDLHDLLGHTLSVLNLSDGTVRNYLSEAIGKLGAGNRIEAARLARVKGWL